MYLSDNTVYLYKWNTWYGSVLRSKYSRKPVANSQNRKLCVSLMVLRHQYVLLLALVHAQNGPTERGREQVRKGGVRVENKACHNSVPKNYFHHTCLGTYWKVQQQNSSNFFIQPYVIPHLSRRGLSASGGCHGWSRWGQACCRCHCFGASWGIYVASFCASAPSAATDSFALRAFWLKKTNTFDTVRLQEGNKK